MSEIEDIDSKDDDGTLEEELRVRRLVLLIELKGIEEKDMTMIKQKSHVQWAEKGDTNSNFFHSTIRWRKVSNDLTCLNVDGAWCDGPILVKSQVKNHFENRFALQLRLRISIDGVQFRSLSMEDNDILCRDITKHEIVDAVRQCSCTKSPGSDGYNFHFIKKQLGGGRA